MFLAQKNFSQGNTNKSKYEKIVCGGRLFKIGKSVVSQSALATALTITAAAISTTPAQASCTISGTVMTCSGATTTPQSTTFGSGILDSVIFAPGGTINIPASGQDALLLESAGPGDLDIIMNTGSGITTSSSGQRGIFAIQNTGHDGDITFTYNGGISDTSSGTHNESYIMASENVNGNISMIMNSGSITSGTPTNPSSNSHAMMAYKSGGTGNTDMVMNGGTINVATNGSFSHGLYVYHRDDAAGNITMTLNDGEINTYNTGTAYGGVGMLGDMRDVATSGTLTMTQTGGRIETSGSATAENSHGIFAYTQAAGDVSVVKSGGEIITNNNFSHGILINRRWGEGDNILDYSGGTIVTNGTGSLGIHIKALGTFDVNNIIVNMSGGSVTTNGADAHALRINNNSFTTVAGVNTFGSSTVNFNGGTLTANGVGADGIFLTHEYTNAYDININDGTIQSGSGYAAGVYIAAFGAPGGTLDIGSTAVIDSSASGIAIRHGDTDRDGIDELSGDITVTSAGTVTGDAILGLGDDTLNLTGGTYTGTIYGDDTIASANDGNDIFNWNGGSLIGGFNGLNGSDTATVFNGASFTGSEILDGGDDLLSTDGYIDTLTFKNIMLNNAKGANLNNWERIDLDGSDVSFVDNILNTGNEANTGLNIFFNGTLRAINGTLNINGNVNNGGIINLQDGSVDDGIIINGNYKGIDGQLGLNTTLFDDTSPTDTFKITGNATGDTRVFIQNVGGAGAQTVDGIKIIEVDGITNADAFQLSGDYVSPLGQQAVVAGAYAYTMNFNEGQKAWFLNSFELPNPILPLYQPATPIYEAYAQHLHDINRLTLPTFQQRLGNRYWSHVIDENTDQFALEVVDTANSQQSSKTDQATELEAAVIDNVFWTRAEGSIGKSNPAFSTSSATSNIARGALQTGIDFLLYQNETGFLFAGLTGSINQGRTHVDSYYGNGNITTNGFALGATATWFSNNGLYIDNQANFNWYNSSLSSNTLGTLASQNSGRGFTASSEIGQKLVLDENWTTTPQAQIYYSNIDFDDFTGRNDERVSLTAGSNNWVARLGVALDYENGWYEKDNTIRRQHIYGIANVYHNFNNNTSVNVSGTELINKRMNWSGELGVGGTYEWQDNNKFYSFAGELSMRDSLQKLGSQTSYKGTLGFKVLF